MNHYDAALSQIENANLPLAEYRTIRRLLDRAQACNGYLEISHNEILNICGTEAWGTVRRHLIRLQDAGIIKKWLNHSTRIWFMAYPAPDWLSDAITERAKVIKTRSLIASNISPESDDRAHDEQMRAHDEQMRAHDEQMRAHDEQMRACDEQMRACDGGGKDQVGKVGRYDLTDPDLQNENLPTSDDDDGAQPDLSRLKTDQLWGYNLLIDREIGVFPSRAVDCVRLNRADRLVRHVASWWVERERVSVRVLVWRLMNPRRSRPGPAGADFLSSALYRRHYPLSDDELGSWKRWQQYGGDEYGDVIQGLSPPDIPPEVEILVRQLPLPAERDGGAP